jgi:GH24 family phage-related lysozyme (muramidase)
MTTTHTTTNRFLDMNRYYATCPDRLPARTRQHAWASSMAATDRVLVVLIENGGIDLGLPDLVNKLVDGIPGASSVIGDDLKARIVTSLRNWLITTTDHLLESAELALNRYTAAKRDKYGDVVVLRDSTATFGELKNALFTASRAGKVVDLLILTHGSHDFISANDGINGARIRTMVTEFGGPLNLRSVYMMNCVGSSLNQAWLDVGARTSAGSHDNNYLPEPTTYFFFSGWKDGTPFEQAVTGAYRRTIDALNSALRGIVVGLVPLQGAAFADSIDVSGLSFVVSSRPEVVGAGSLGIESDVLPSVSGGPAQGASTGQSMVTTVLTPARTQVRPMSVDRTVSPSGRMFISRFEAPGPLLEQRILAVERYLSERIARPLTQPQVDALACFGIGVGSKALQHSTLLRMLDDGDFAAVPAEIRKWTKIRKSGQIVENEALLERRRAEAELFGGAAAALAIPASREVQEYAYQQNPALMIAGIELGDAIQIGLAGAAIVQSQINAFPGGSLQVTYDSQQRLLAPQARLDMPGSMRPKNTYTRTLFWLPSLGPNLAEALIKITWDGNDYGEIGTPTISKDLDQTSDWSRSSASINVRAVSRIPVGADPRTWPLWYHYEGNFDPWANGEWDFNGDFEINAFGGIAFHDHKWKSRSQLEFAVDVHPDKWKGPDVTAAVPTIPADQMDYLRGHAPG